MKIAFMPIAIAAGLLAGQMVRLVRGFVEPA
jgi:hypothetical protein